MNPNVILVISFVIAAAGIAWGFYMSKKPVTLEGIVHAAEQVPSAVTEVEKAATVVVNSYEQARRKNKLENTPALNEVMNKVRGWLPDAVKVSITNDQIVQAINSAILLASAATAQINASKPAPPLTMTHTIGTPSFPDTFTGKQP